MANTKLYFDGNADPNTFLPFDGTALQIGAVTDFSIGAIVNLRKKTTTIQNDDHCIAYCDFSFGGDEGGAFYVAQNTGAVNVFVGASNYSSGISLFTYETEQNVIFTLTGTTVACYIGGVSVWSTTVVRKATLGSTSNPIAQEGFQFRGLYGTIRNFFAVKRLLTSAEIASIQTRTYPADLNPFYKMDEAVGIVLKDSGPNNNFCTITPISNGVAFPNWQPVPHRNL